MYRVVEKLSDKRPGAKSSYFYKLKVYMHQTMVDAGDRNMQLRKFQIGFTIFFQNY